MKTEKRHISEERRDQKIRRTRTCVDSSGSSAMSVAFLAFPQGVMPEKYTPPWLTSSFCHFYLVFASMITSIPIDVGLSYISLRYVKKYPPTLHAIPVDQ